MEFRTATSNTQNYVRGFHKHVWKAPAIIVNKQDRSTLPEEEKNQAPQQHTTHQPSLYYYHTLTRNILPPSMISNTPCPIQAITQASTMWTNKHLPSFQNIYATIIPTPSMRQHTIHTNCFLTSPTIHPCTKHGILSRMGEILGTDMTRLYRRACGQRDWITAHGAAPAPATWFRGLDGEGGGGGVFGKILGYAVGIGCGLLSLCC